MNPYDPGSDDPTPDLLPHHAGRLSRALTAAACLTLFIAGGVACTTSERPSAESSPAPGRPATTTTAAPTPEVTTRPAAPTTAAPATEAPPTTEAIEGPPTTVAVVEDACRPETAPIGPDGYGVTHTGEKICTWGPGLVAHLDGNGFVIPSQNHPVDVAMAQDCWSSAGRLYLRTPAVEGWACI
ncbi:MAG: hypothetical protein QOI56_1825 [Actinomycetota bacterium]|jgi:hypothetical protein|nr:hypothetical protein [Actinomycetota bacterium]